MTLSIQGALGQGTRNWRPETRADHFVCTGWRSREDALPLRATNGGRAIYDYQRERWQPPLTVEDGYPHSSGRCIGVDPLANELWLGTAQGSLLRCARSPPNGKRGHWTRRAVLAIVLLSSSRMMRLFQTRSGWHRAQRLSFVVQRVPIASFLRGRAAAADSPGSIHGSLPFEHASCR